MPQTAGCLSPAPSLPSSLSKAPAAQLPRSLLARKSVTARLVQQVALQPHPSLTVTVRVPYREDLGVLLEPAPRPSGHAARHHFVLERGALHREVLYKHCAQPAASANHSLDPARHDLRQRNRSRYDAQASRAVVAPEMTWSPPSFLSIPTSTSTASRSTASGGFAPDCCFRCAIHHTNR